MCGIAGALTLAPSVDARAEIEAMTAALYHRGPDAGAVFVDELAGVCARPSAPRCHRIVGARRAAHALCRRALRLRLQRRNL